MAVIAIRKYPDPILRKKSKKVKEVDDAVRRIFDDMAMTMYAVRGVGIAAPQIGVDKRLIAVDAGSGLVKLANPEITKSSGVSVLEEGCLSVPNTYVKVKRAAKITIKGLDENGREKTITAEGLMAHAFQQEVDHINGKLIIDYLPFYKKIFKK